MDLYKALETIKNECTKHTECADCPFALGHSYCGIITNGFPENGIYKSLLISYLRQKQYMRKNGDRYGK